VRYAPQEMKALLAKGLGVLNRLFDPVVFSGYRLTVHNFDALIIDSEFARFSNVVKDHHSLRSNDDEPLLLIRMQPADKYVRANSRLELKVSHGDVGYVRLQVSPPGG